MNEVVCQPYRYLLTVKLYDCVRYDLKEIVFPSSLPDPPHLKKRRKLTWHERFLVLKEASWLYAASWVRDIGLDLRPNDYNKDEENDDKPNKIKGATKQKEPSTLEDLVNMFDIDLEQIYYPFCCHGHTRGDGDAEAGLQRVYMTRASAYRDVLERFIEGYQEGIQQVVDKKQDGKSEETSNSSGKAG
ncbi:hypothetical protein MLD38_017307 [Melastoma candidum]|uniref:Uncharacterized protein n=1 Tax=Melastoma candidum TaxID=119954 RepID=A0ACB9QU98_9MYRT|nr:hypothetical protein MLD38_017307 [Melastoma candidum]